MMRGTEGPEPIQQTGIIRPTVSSYLQQTSYFYLISSRGTVRYCRAGTKLSTIGGNFVNRATDTRLILTK